MNSTGSVTGWLDALKAGDDHAATHLWDRYYSLLVSLARKHLQGCNCRSADEEDVALSAFDSFCRAAESRRYPDLNDRDDLWRLLVVITCRKALDLLAYEHRKKRGGLPTSATSSLLDQLLAREPDPGFAAEVAEECRILLRRLPSEEMRHIAIWKMEGFTNAEIAGKLGCTRRTVERRLELIRSLWSGEGQA